MIRSWNWDPASKRFAIAASLVAHTRPISSLVLMATETPPALYSAAADGTVRCVRSRVVGALCVCCVPTDGKGCIR